MEEVVDAEGNDHEPGDGDRPAGQSDAPAQEASPVKSTLLCPATRMHERKNLKHEGSGSLCQPCLLDLCVQFVDGLDVPLTVARTADGQEIVRHRWGN